MGERTVNSNQSSDVRQAVFIRALVRNLAQAVVSIHGYSQLIADEASPRLSKTARLLVRASGHQQITIQKAQSLLRLVEACQRPHCVVVNLQDLFLGEDTNRGFRIHRNYQLPPVLGDPAILRAALDVLSDLAGKKPIQLFFRVRSGYLVIKLEGLGRWLGGIQNQSITTYSDSLDQLLFASLQAGFVHCGGRMHFIEHAGSRFLYLRLRLSAQLQIDIQ